MEIEMLKATRTETSELLRALRNWHPTHDELIDFLAGVASMVKANEHALGQQCQSFVVDQLDECIGQIEQDQIDQQAEQAGDDRPKSALDAWFPSLAQLDALTIRRTA